MDSAEGAALRGQFVELQRRMEPIQTGHAGQQGFWPQLGNLREELRRAESHFPMTALIALDRAENAARAGLIERAREAVREAASHYPHPE